MVEHHVANVRVASSNLVSRSIEFKSSGTPKFKNSEIIEENNFNFFLKLYHWISRGDFMSNDQVYWKAGQTIYNFNDESDFAYLLKKGEVQIISDRNINVGFINENEVFGEQSILLGTRRTVTAKASKDSEAMKIPRENLLKEYEKSSILIKAILRSTYLRLTNLDHTMQNDLKSFPEEK